MRAAGYGFGDNVGVTTGRLTYGVYRQQTAGVVAC
jgi:hypothetical protein